MKDINADELLKATIESQSDGEKEQTDDEIEFVKILDTPDKGLKQYIGSMGKIISFVKYNEEVFKYKVLFDDGNHGYFKSTYVKKLNIDEIVSNVGVCPDNFGLKVSMDDFEGCGANYELCQACWEEALKNKEENK